LKGVFNTMKKKLSIEGMSCQHCVNHVTEALKEIEGVRSVKVTLETKSAEVDLVNDVDESKLKDAIDEVGYELVKVETI